jgi:hypothetical protein
MERVLVLVAAAALLAVVIGGVRLYARWRTARVKAAPVENLWEALGVRPDGRPTLVAFSGKACRECIVQAREIEHLGLDDVRRLEFDAAARQDVARTFGVLTIPSTVVLDVKGRIQAVNHGLVERGTLGTQLIRANR